jgi:hypothetical protein
MERPNLLSSLCLSAISADKNIEEELKKRRSVDDSINELKQAYASVNASMRDYWKSDFID